MVMSQKITGDKTIANGFNNLFVNIGPSLAKIIPKWKDSYLRSSYQIK